MPDTIRPITVTCATTILAVCGFARLVGPCPDPIPRANGAFSRAYQHGTARLTLGIDIDWSAGEFTPHRMWAESPEAAKLRERAWEMRDGWDLSWPTETSTQSLPTRGRPHAGAVVGEDGLAVASFDPRGDLLVIELWRFQWPDTMPEPDPVTHRVPVVEPGRAEVREVLAEPLARHGRIRQLAAMSRKDAPPATLLALLDEVSMLVTIDLGTGAVEPLASGESHEGRLGLVPALAELRLESLSVEDEPGTGFVYRVERRLHCPLPPRARVLRLFDRDRDGRIDGWDDVLEPTFRPVR